jgi:translation initiation factor IF-2
VAEKMRVHLLADELGVSSKAVLAKCRAEGLDIRNHMSTLSAGQVATIREWFSEGAHATTVETTERVDLEKARAKRRHRAGEAVKAAEEAETKEAGEELLPIAETAEPVARQVGEAVAVEEAPVATVETPELARAVKRRSPAEIAQERLVAEPAHGAEPGVVTPGAPAVPATAADKADRPSPGPGTATAAPSAPPAIPAIALTPAAVVPAVEMPAAPAAHAPAVAKPPAVPGVAKPAARAPESGPSPAVAAPPVPPPPPPPPEPIKPAGPRNIPAPAQLKGPKVVRVERPEPIHRPYTRPSPSRGPAAPPPIVPTAPGRRGRERARTAEEIEEEKRKAKHRVHPRRSGVASEAGERLKEWRDRDLIERQEKIQAASGRGIHAHRAVEAAKGQAVGRVAPRKTRVEMTEPIVLHEYCAATGIGMQQLAPKLMREHNILPSRNTKLDSELAQLLALDFGIELTVHKAKTPLDLIREQFEKRERLHLEKRPPVVTFLGHVDHGKTSLLDAIRQARVVEGEAGGITQHIGAYRLDRDGRSVTFLDTPGHEAFTAMRARGANMTDVVVLVVAADDGVMPQTIEAINHAKAAGVPIVVALNKIDMPNADPNRVFGQLSEHGLVPQKWGGEVDVIETSATKGIGIDDLVEHLSTLSDLLDLKADPTVPATGTVIEAELREGAGPVGRVLVREGTLREGDIILCGPAAGRVRALRDDLGRRVHEAGPGTPVELAGLDCVPGAGDPFYQLSDLQAAKEIAESVAQQRREQSLTRLSRPRTLEDLFMQRQAGQIPTLNLIVRADVQGSVDVLKKTLAEIPSEQVKLVVLHAAVGSIAESDVVLAEASKALIVGFHVVPDQGAARLAEQKGVEIKLYRVIYNLTDDIRKALEGLLEPERKEEFQGRAEVRQVFSVSRIGKVAGCYVTEGTIHRSSYARVLRDGRIILPTAEDAERGRHRSLTSLRRFKDDAHEVRAGLECGLKVEDYDDIQPGDLVEAYKVVEVARKL